MSSATRASVVADTLVRGGLIAYPTEAVWGLGCDPYNTDAVRRLCRLKKRPLNKGVLLVTGDIAHVSPFLECLPSKTLDKVLASWPGAVTWVLPNYGLLPDEVTGGRDTVAIRVSCHPVIKQISSKYNGFFVSTSANLTGYAPIKTVLRVRKQFGAMLDDVVPGDLGVNTQPSVIFDALSGKQLR